MPTSKTEVLRALLWLAVANPQNQSNLDSLCAHISAEGLGISRVERAWRSIESTFPLRFEDLEWQAYVRHCAHIFAKPVVYEIGRGGPHWFTVYQTVTGIENAILTFIETINGVSNPGEIYIFREGARYPERELMQMAGKLLEE